MIICELMKKGDLRRHLHNMKLSKYSNYYYYNVHL